MITQRNFVFVVALLLFPATSSAKDPILNLFSTFTTSQSDTTFQLLGNSTINNGALQITLDSANVAFMLNMSGRVMLPKPFKLWEAVSNNSNKNSSMDIVASFNSTFLLNIERPINGSGTPGEGFAFIITPYLNIPSYSYGQWLGLTNATLDGDPSNKIVAIELDTVKQDFDPDDNHLGLNINSVKSNMTVSLSNFGIQISPEGETKYYNVWIQYDGRAELMEVYMAAKDSYKPSSPVLSKEINLKNYVNQYSYMGFSASTGVNAQLTCVVNWYLSVEDLSSTDLRWVKILIGVGVPVLVLLGFVVFRLQVRYRKRRVVNDPIIMGKLKSLPGMPREFSFKDLKEATNNFDDKNMLGKGGFGVVYWGFVLEEKIEIAVKKFSRDYKQSINDFIAELTIINRLRHKHLVRLVGWCHKKGLLLLVYNYMPNGSLDKHLFGGTEKIINWEHRYKILAGVASALYYLHDQFDQRVIHRDLKASNVMLDSDFNARLGDFGLARALDNQKTSYTDVEGPQGTLGYMAPEFLQTAKATTESDVFAFRAVVLEVVCGQRPSIRIAGFECLVNWVWTLYHQGRILEAIDVRLMDVYDSHQARRLLLLGLACSHPIAAERPKAPDIVQILSGSVPTPNVPYIKPAFVWPAMSSDSLITDTQNTPSRPLNSSYYNYDGSEEWTHAARAMRTRRVILICPWHDHHHHLHRSHSAFVNRVFFLSFLL